MNVDETGEITFGTPVAMRGRFPCPLTLMVSRAISMQTAMPITPSPAIPRIYRMKFHRDIYKDLRALEKSIGDGTEENSNLDVFYLEMFENIAYVMAKHADNSISDTPEEWLDEFNTFSIYQVLPKLIELWGLNV